MLHTVVKSNDNKLVLDLPNDLIGKTIEIIAFDVEKSKENISELSSASKALELERVLTRYQKDLSAYKFDRDDANDYD